ncbi:MAG: hypothetical protein AAGI34_07720 [Pseudomonadota bacterium]
MRAEITVILDDRLKPTPDIVAIIGATPYTRILRRRRRLGDDIRAAAARAGAEFVLVTDDDQAAALAERIENRGVGPRYIRLPAYIAPLNMGLLARTLEKASFALETTLLAPISTDDAPALLEAGGAVEMLRAPNAEARRAILLRLSESATHMVDRLAMIDLRNPRALLRFLAGSTETRHFNNARAEAGIFKKSSQDRAKMTAEYQYYHVVPERMRRFLLSTFDFWENDTAAGYSMEHLLIPDTALQVVHSVLQPEDFELLLERFFAFIAARETSPPDRAHTLATAEAQILGKLDRRVAEFLALPAGQRVEAILAACGAQGSLRALHERARAAIAAELRRDTTECLVVSHGDPCFSNILFDRRLGLMRLIDPRGAVQREDALMHPLYDLAKFSHSILGGYDFINNGLFECVLDTELGLALKLPSGAIPETARAGFIGAVARAGFELRAVRAVELSLFLSMLPLHADHPQKLVGFALTAVDILKALEADTP